MLNYFDEHFVSSGFIFDNTVKLTDNQTSSNMTETPSKGEYQAFHCHCHKALLKSDLKKSAGELKLATYFVAEPLTYIYNLTLISKEIPQIWKMAHILPLLKHVDSNPNNYRPISNLSPLAKILETLVSDQLKNSLDSIAFFILL